MSTSADRTWPLAGSWIRRYFSRSGWATARWHLFTGDVTWSEDWPGPSLETACGYATGPLWSSDALNVEDDEPVAPCRLCLARAGSTVPSHSAHGKRSPGRS